MQPQRPWSREREILKKDRETSLAGSEGDPSLPRSSSNPPVTFYLLSSTSSYSTVYVRTLLHSTANQSFSGLLSRAGTKGTAEPCPTVGGHKLLNLFRISSLVISEVGRVEGRDKGIRILTEGIAYSMFSVKLSRSLYA